MKSIMNDANTTPLLSQTLNDEPQLDLDSDKKVIAGTNVTRPNQQDHHSWLVPFLVNIFLSNIASSVILPILAPYLTQIGIHESYLPWVIFIHHIGGLIGSTTMGVLYDYITRIYQVEGRGAKICLLMCPLVGIVGSVLYTSAEWIGDADVAKWLVLFGRLLQGFWRGGQQAIELAYLSTAVEPSVKTEYTATLGTFAVLGSVTGPSIGALFSLVDTTINGLPLNAYNVPGFLIIVATSIMFVQTLLFFDGKNTQPDIMNIHKDKEVCDRSSTLDTRESSLISIDEDSSFDTAELYPQNGKEIRNDGSIVDAEESSLSISDEDEHPSDIKGNGSNTNTLRREESSPVSELPFNMRGVLMSIYLIAVFQYCFSVQETITTPMVRKLYDWSATEINLLFAGAGVVSILSSLSVRYLSRRVLDQKLLIASIMIGLLGSILQMDIPPFEKILPVGRFIAGFMLTYIAFAMVRNVVMGIFSNVLAPYNQGKWMGAITAAQAITRAIVPFLAWQAINVVHWRTWLEFGLRSLFLLSALVGSIMTIRFLVPYSEFVRAHSLNANLPE